MDEILGLTAVDRLIGLKELKISVREGFEPPTAVLNQVLLNADTRCDPAKLRSEMIRYRFPAAIARTRNNNFIYGGEQRHAYITSPRVERSSERGAVLPFRSCVDTHRASSGQRR